MGNIKPFDTNETDKRMRELLDQANEVIDRKLKEDGYVYLNEVFNSIGIGRQVCEEKDREIIDFSDILSHE